jgi:hypothetical protein
VGLEADDFTDVRHKVSPCDSLQLSWSGLSIHIPEDMCRYLYWRSAKPLNRLNFQLERITFVGRNFRNQSLKSTRVNIHHVNKKIISNAREYSPS